MNRQDHYGTYRCPVCGHRDGTELSGAEASRVVQCRHCAAVLEVSGRGRESARFEAQVARETVRG